MSRPDTESFSETVELCLERNREKLGALLPLLHDVQEELGYVPPSTIPQIAAGLELSRAEVQGVIDFYHDFRTTPPGRYVIQICRAEACQAMGAVALEQHVSERLGVGMGETASNGRYTLEPVYCLGNCACSPSIMINQSLHARVNADRFDEIMNEMELHSR